MLLEEELFEFIEDRSFPLTTHFLRENFASPHGYTDEQMLAGVESLLAKKMITAENPTAENYDIQGVVTNENSFLA